MGFTWVGFSLACKYQSRVEVTNTLAYYSTELNTEVKKIYDTGFTFTSQAISSYLGGVKLTWLAQQGSSP
jgi:hypothetical protein